MIGRGHTLKRDAILNIFRTESELDDELIWLILGFSGVAGSGHYSMFFWVYS